MHTYFSFFFSLLFAVAVESNAKQATAFIEPQMKNHFNIIQQDISEGGKVYRLFIAQPKDKTRQKPTALYLLDANAHFPLAVNAVDPNKALPMIIGIGYATSDTYDKIQRTRDYTVPAEGDEFAQGGGAEHFLRFISQNVIPYINQHYSASEDQRVFFGHSFGGLFGLYVLFNQPELFQHYSIASPSLWWGKGAITHMNPLAQKAESVLITLGEYEQHPERDPNITPERLARIRQRQQIISTETFATQLTEQGYRTEFKLLPRKNHGGTIAESIKLTIEKIQN